MNSPEKIIFLKGTCKTLWSVMIVSVVAFIICVGILLIFSGDQINRQNVTAFTIIIVAVGIAAYFIRRRFVRELEQLSKETSPEAVKDAVVNAKRSYEFISGGIVFGAVVGFLLRPAAPLVGQLPFSVVINRGASLQGLDQFLVPVAQTSFNYMVAGAVVGYFVGLGAEKLFKKK